MLDSDLDASRKMLDVNVVAAFSWIKKAVAAGLGDERPPGRRRERRVGRRARAPPASSACTACRKAALIHLTDELGYQLGPDVRVNAVAPAVVKTQFAEALYEGREEKVAAPTR